ncbi:hypothetical protein HR12_11060 [Microbacterium sp. SUBG005]|nr:hypothetical protein HR12_11060 [Microbacterium sp. SUBG005]
MRHRLAGFTAGKQCLQLRLLFSGQRGFAESQEICAGFTRHMLKQNFGVALRAFTCRKLTGGMA